MNQCRECRCTDDRCCSLAGVPCYWIERDLCSTCAPIGRVLESRGGLVWLLTVAAAITAAVEQELSDPAVAGVGIGELVELEYAS